MLGVVCAVGIPVTLLLPAMITRAGDRPVLPWAFALLTAAGWAGMLVAPATASWLWAVLLGAGSGAFTWLLTMFGRRAATVEGTAALSAFAQSIGYVLSGIGPFGTALLHDATGSWTAPVATLLVASFAIGALGALVNRDRLLENELDVG